MIICTRIIYVLIVAALIPLFVQNFDARAANIIDSTVIINETNSVEEETTIIKDGLSPPTVVSIVEGGKLGDDESRLPIAVEMQDSSELHLRGGEVGTALIGSVGIWAKDSTKVLIESGTVDTQGTGIRGEGKSQIVISGGFVGGPADASVRLMNQSSLDISGGRFDGLIGTHDESTAAIRGGFVAAPGPVVSAAGTGNIRIQGGEFLAFGTDIAFEASNNSSIDIYGFGLVLSNGRLTGQLQDGSVLDHGVLTRDSGQIILHEVPEPTLSIPILVGVTLCIHCVRKRLRSVRSAFTAIVAHPWT